MKLEFPKTCRKLTQSRSIETKNAILESGIQLFANQGYYKVNTKEIAKAAGISIGSFYGYYEDKKQLFIELVHIYKEELMSAALCQNEARPDCSLITQEEIIQHFVSQKLKVAEKYPLAFHHELNHMRFRDADVAAICDSYLLKEIDIYEVALTVHAPCLRIQNFKIAAEMLYQISDDMINAYLSRCESTEKDALIASYKEMLTRYLFK